MIKISNIRNQLLKLLPSGKIKQLFFEKPAPIIFPEKRLIMLWSAKAGSTFSMKWIFSQMNLFEQAQDYHKWIHRYRLEIYYLGKQYHKGLKLFLKEPDSFNIIKIIDNPFKRAVRSYIHACIHGYEDKKLSSFLNRKINSENRFSFREFCHYLSKIDITKCDIHHKSQVSELERRDYLNNIHLVYLDESMKEIPRLEKLFVLEKIDLLPLRKSDHHCPKYETSKFMGDVVMNSIYNEAKSSIPEYKQFYDAEIIKLVLNVYHEDFEQYHFEKEL